MTVIPGGSRGADGSAETTKIRSQDPNATLARAYLQTHRGPHGDAPAADSTVTAPIARSIAGGIVTPALLAAHGKVGRKRSMGETKVAVYASGDESGCGPAIQIVT